MVKIAGFLFFISIIVLLKSNLGEWLIHKSFHIIFMGLHALNHTLKFQQNRNSTKIKFALFC